MTKVNDTLKRIADKNGWSDKEVSEHFGSFVAESFPEVWAASGNTLLGLSEDDFDFFSSSWEVTTERRTGGGGGKGDEWVGMVIGYDRTMDTMGRQREAAVSAAEFNMGNALRDGCMAGNRAVKIGRVSFSEGKWRVHNAADAVVFTEDGKEGELPRWCIPIHSGNTHIAMLKDDGKSPKIASLPKRTWFFVGNRKDAFLKEGPQPMMEIECSFEAAEEDLNLFQPILFRAEAEAAWNNPDKTILKATSISPNYGLDWVPEEALPAATAMFSPDQFMAQFGSFVDLGEAFDYHMENRTMLQSGKDFGPVFVVSGVVDYIDHDGKEHQWTEGGFKHSMTLTSQSLRRDDPNAQMWIDVSRQLVSKHNAFKVKKADGWKPYTKGSRVWVVVRTRTWTSDNGDVNLNLDAKGVYAMPLRSIVAPDVSPASSDLSNLDYGDA